MGIGMRYLEIKDWFLITVIRKIGVMTDLGLFDKPEFYSGCWRFFCQKLIGLGVVEIGK
jgi:hypothetical protein